MTNVRTAETRELVEELRRRQIAVITVDAADIAEALRESGKAKGRDDEHINRFGTWFMEQGGHILHVESFIWDEARRQFVGHLIAESYELFIGDTEGHPDEAEAAKA